MRISVITVCLNAAKTLGDAVESVLRQKTGGGDEIEYIVVDGGSSDGTAGILASAAARSAAVSFRWVSEADGGMYEALDKGVGMATGDIVGVLNADDVFDGDGVLARVAEEWRGAEAAVGRLDCLYGNVRFVGKLGGPTVRVCFARLWRPWMLQWGYMPPHPAVFIRRGCFAEWGGYVPDAGEYRIAADYELLIRFFRVKRMKARYMPVCTTVMRTGGASTRDAAARRRLNAEIVKANRANGYFCCMPMLLPKYAVKVWEFILPRMSGRGVRT
ncbi:MAG: glycosyltransferase [Kiritimatiellae bacterium]|nr:glycosyltransferase [Kiritimatiellia bacterium]